MSKKYEKWNINKIKELVNKEGYKLDKNTIYKGYHEPLKMICPRGHDYKCSLCNFLSGKRCGKCKGNVKYTYDEVKSYIESKGYKLESKNYTKNDGKLDLVCPEGHNWSCSFANFKNKKRRCSKCYGNKKLTYDEIKSYIESRNYKLESKEYTKANSPLDLTCPEGHKWTTDWNHFKRGERCSFCNMSGGEAEISYVLNKMEINFETQYKFEDCKFYNQLPFDFYIPDLNIAIEYDGEQHFEIGRFNGTLDDFVDIKIRDTVKNVYCDKNNIKLLRIPYWEFQNINEIIHDFVNINKK